ncbi:MAG: hypothetical protein EXR75_01970 [Myxococcales bacterium]|nr:hypothetical protein [Myxococcales bacterium]
MLHKQKPLHIKPFAELLLGLTGAGHSLDRGSPILSLLQWASEPADPPAYGRHVVHEPIVGGPRHVLMMQGVVDDYIMAPIANAMSLAFGLDLAGDALDEQSAELAGLAPIASLLALVKRGAIDLPQLHNTASAKGEPATAVVAQTLEDGLEDGHEVVFQTASPKHAYACFLAGLAKGAPVVPAAANGGSPCE